jgi:hypothetical protein
MNGPLVRSDGTQTIGRQVDAFANPHAGMTEQQQDSTEEIIAAKQLLLDELILFRGQWTWEAVLFSGNIIRTEKAG